MRSSPVKSSRRQTLLVITATIFFIAMTLVLSGLVAHVVSTMRTSANEIDDRRAVKAAEAAIAAFKDKLAATVRDNAVWDDAYAAVNSAEALAWIHENWGQTSADYALYDGVIVTRADGSVLAAYQKGRDFDPPQKFGPQLAEQARTAAHPGLEPSINVYKTDDGITVVGTQAIQPFAVSASIKGYSTLTFFKKLSSEVLVQLAVEHQLDDLSLKYALPANRLNVNLKDVEGNVAAYLTWPSKAPGNQVYEQVYPYIAAAIVLLVLFLAAVFVAGNVEIARLRRFADEAHLEATHDSLSGLLNRSGLLHTLDGVIRGLKERQSLKLYLIDLDGFKAVNDAWGHAVGDELIRLVAQALSQSHAEVMAAARLGGDEFALVQLGLAEPAVVTQAVLNIVAAPFAINGRTIEVGASIGVVVATGPVEPLELLRRADMALYRAKEDGKGRAVTYQTHLDEERQRMAELEDMLRAAIDNGDIEPVFQPLVSATTGQLQGVEALARWHPSSGSVSPEIFIPLAERTGLIDRLGTQMLQKSIGAVSSWNEINLAVNVSPIQLCNPGFALELIALLKQEDFDPDRLTLEITEGVLMSNPDQARRAIRALRKIGVRFALDDFGCGYASIGALRQFGFDRMKIDRSLVSAIDQESNGMEILKATISLASALRIPVTAEGIETTRQFEILRDTGCDQLQGFLVGEPMTQDKLEQILFGQVHALRL
jgi:diguanylate cyclase (GGDEF)-like protein